MIVKQFLQEILDKKQDSEIAKFQDIDLKLDIKKAYMQINSDKKENFNKKNVNIQTSNNNLTVDERKSSMFSNNIQNNNKKDKINDLNNLNFMKNLRK